jgi:hypothetical protein
MVAARSKIDLGRVFTHIHDQEIEISERFNLDPSPQFAPECQRQISAECPALFRECKMTLIVAMLAFGVGFLIRPFVYDDRRHDFESLDRYRNFSHYDD